ncbi:4876_t:CDS:2, partial [Funneliformis geosporum]
ELKLQIMSIQSERDRLNLLISEYVSDNLSTSIDRNIKSRKDALWKLIADLRLAFENPNSLKTSINRLHDIYKQDVEKSITRNTCGRRMKNVITNLVSQQKQQKQKH